MTNEMTHDDIINKEIEEEHEFMRARIKELENKPTYPFNEAFNKQLQEENAFLKNTINYFAEIFEVEKPDYTTNKDFADFIGKVENKLQVKEQECEEYKKKFSRFFNIDNQECWDIAFLNNEKAKYKQALDEIEQTISNFPSKGIQDIPQTQIECTLHFLSVSEAKLQKILDIIRKTKDSERKP